MWIRRLWTNDKAASMVEYALLIVLIAIVAIVALALVGDQVAAIFDRAATDLGSDPVAPATTTTP